DNYGSDWHDSLEDPKIQHFPEEFTKGSFTFTLICSFICVYTYIFAVLLNKVSLDVTVEGFIGGSVVLPCSSAEHDLKLQEVDVSWRHNGSKNVCDLIPRSNSIETQDPRYKNRTKTFPEGYERRNFSIKLTDLTHADAGKYICLITPSDEQKTVELIVNEFFVAEPTTEKGIKTTDQENQEETRPDSVEKSWLWILVVTLLTVLSLLFIVIIFRRKIPSCLKSGEHGVGSDTREDVSPGPRYKSVTADDRDEAAKAGE
uniref:Ig-like domain-containing protein n=1 Tax=Cyprinus carpio TaxID=7962 RepID=A0A8C2DAA8_CYPCA